MDVAAFPVSLFALLVSVATLLRTEYRWHKDGARLKIEARTIMVNDRGHFYDVLWIVVKNKGRSSTEIDAVDFPTRHRFKTSFESLTKVPEPRKGDKIFPYLMSEGVVANFSIPVASLLSTVSMFKADPSQLRIRVRTGHGYKIKRLPKDLVAELERRLVEREAEQGG